MMTSRKFALLALSINMAIILFTGVTNFCIDGESSRHLPSDPSIIPRTTKQTAPAKLNFIYKQQPSVLYFGSSRVEVGLPVAPGLFGDMSVYNAGLLGNTLGNTIPLIMHVLGGYTPKIIVLGVDFVTFTTKPSSTHLDMSLLSSDFPEYRRKRLWYDVQRSVTLDASEHSFRALHALYNRRPYDPIDGAASVGGQTSDKEMQRLVAPDGQYFKAFQKTLQDADRAPPPDEVSAGMKLFENFVAAACARSITIRVFSNPRHALAEYMLAKNGNWDEVERWKAGLADIATRYQQHCDLKIFDFAGFNSVTAEPVDHMSPAVGLLNHWEMSHFKGAVGKLILKRMFAPDASLPSDFGRELNNYTVSEINSLSSGERKTYEALHSKAILMANAWFRGDTRR
jgi:hypothetical protein